MAGKSMKQGKTEKQGDMIVSFTVAECGEFHNLGEYHENIKTVEEAATIYRNIPPERMNGIPAIGIRLHRKGQPAYEDLQLDILNGRTIEIGLIHYVPEAENNPLVWEAVEELKRLFPEKEVVDF